MLSGGSNPSCLLATTPWLLDLHPRSNSLHELLVLFNQCWTCRTQNWSKWCNYPCSKNKGTDSFDNLIIPDFTGPLEVEALKGLTLKIILKSRSFLSSWMVLHIMRRHPHHHRFALLSILSIHISSNSHTSRHLSSTNKLTSTSNLQ